MKAYSESEILTALKKLENWKYENQAIVRNFKFKDFSQALAFIIQVGLLAEKANHHPEILSIYNKVQILLNTHDANGVTEKDFELAKLINDI